MGVLAARATERYLSECRSYLNSVWVCVCVCVSVAGGGVCVCVSVWVYVCVCVSMNKVLSFLSFPLPEYSELSERSEKHGVNADCIFTKALFSEPLTLSDDGGR